MHVIDAILGLYYESTIIRKIFSSQWQIVYYIRCSNEKNVLAAATGKPRPPAKFGRREMGNEGRLKNGMGRI